MTSPLAADRPPPYPRSRPEGVLPQPLGVPPHRVLLVAAAWLAVVALVLVACGLGTPYQVPVVATWCAVPIVLAAVAGVLGPLRRSPPWLRILLVTAAAAVALMVWLAVLVARPTTIAATTSPDGDLRAALTSAGPDGVAVRVERPGLLVEELGAVCAYGTSGAPRIASVRWTGPTTFTVDIGGSDVLGTWRFRVDDAGVRSLGRRAWDAC